MAVGITTVIESADKNMLLAWSQMVEAGSNENAWTGDIAEHLRSLFSR